jgi:hypothetical protein
LKAEDVSVGDVEARENGVVCGLRVLDVRIAPIDELLWQPMCAEEQQRNRALGRDQSHG